MEECKTRTKLSQESESFCGEFNGRTSFPRLWKLMVTNEVRKESLPSEWKSCSVQVCRNAKLGPRFHGDVNWWYPSKEECNDRASLKSQLGADLWLHPSMDHVKVEPHFRGAVKTKGDRSNLTENESRSWGVSRVLTIGCTWEMRGYDHISAGPIEGCKHGSSLRWK